MLSESCICSWELSHAKTQCHNSKRWELHELENRASSLMNVNKDQHDRIVIRVAAMRSS